MLNDGQNQDSELGAKKSGVIFFKPKLLDPEHGEYKYFLSTYFSKKWDWLTLIVKKRQ